LNRGLRIIALVMVLRAKKQCVRMKHLLRPDYTLNPQR
jgi:hypothetical protein